MLFMSLFINYVEGAAVRYDGRRYVITHLLDLECVLAKDAESGKSERLYIRDLTPLGRSSQTGTQEGVMPVLIEKEKWEEAEQWFERISPLLSCHRRTTEMIREIARDAGVHPATVYRKLSLFEQLGKVSSLTCSKSNGGKGKSRLSEEVEKIIQATIEEFYLNKQKQKRLIKKTVEEVKRRCVNAKVTSPHSNTVAKRIRAISKKKKDEHHLGTYEAELENEAFIGHFPRADFPLAVIQIDHAILDIIIVDDLYGIPIGRPWITLAIDVFSRMVVGFFISLDRPNTMSVGLCLAHSILPKDKFLAGHNITTAWPCWGLMRKIHADNAGEFRGDMMKRLCKDYGMDLEWRPVKKPHYGAHIERLIGTILKEIHNLAGTTFSNPEERGQYDSEGHAVWTKAALEKWLTDFITGVYHQRVHSALGTSPIKRYELGIFGNEEMPGRGLPARIVDEDRLRLDLMPYVKRTIQGSYGIVLDHIHYYSDVLKRFVNAKDPTNAKRKRKFIFKRDPRDISILYFYDPDLNQYFKIPYRDTSHPPMSIWEYRKVSRKLKEEGKKNIDERLIFETYERMRQQEEQVKRETKRMRREAQRRRDNQQIVRPKTADERSLTNVEDNAPNVEESDINPFEDIEEPE
jgi:putative transposase